MTTDTGDSTGAGNSDGPSEQPEQGQEQEQGQRYAADIMLESGERTRRPTPDEFRALLGQLGWYGVEWLTADPIPEDPGRFFQVLRESTDCYRVEVRDGGEEAEQGTERLVATLARSPEAVEALLAAWAEADDSWRTAADWTPFEELDSEVTLDAELAEEARQVAREVIASGYLTADQAAQILAGHYSERSGRPLIVQAQTERIIAPLWAERLTEQAEWPERTDADALEAAFAALERRNIVARDNFACCASCGHSEIRAEAGPDSVGYVFFHHQSTQQAVAEGRLWLYFGTCGEREDRAESGGEKSHESSIEGDDAGPGVGAGAAADAAVPAEDPEVAIGAAIVEEIARVGLPVEWNGESSKAILVSPIDWRKRLPVAADRR
jgi:hypothetical protein